MRRSLLWVWRCRGWGFQPQPNVGTAANFRDSSFHTATGCRCLSKTREAAAGCHSHGRDSDRLNNLKITRTWLNAGQQAAVKHVAARPRLSKTSSGRRDDTGKRLAGWPEERRGRGLTSRTISAGSRKWARTIIATCFPLSQYSGRGVGGEGTEQAERFAAPFFPGNTGGEGRKVS